MSGPAVLSEDRPFWGYGDLALFLMAGVPALVAAGILVRTLFSLLGWPWEARAPQLLAGQLLAYGFWFGFLYALLRVKYRRPFWRSLGWVDPGSQFWERLLLGVGLALGVAVLGGLLRTPNLDTPMKRLLSDRASVWLIGAAAATIGPACEELAFRGFVQPLLVRTLGAAPGIILTALPFALLHGPEYAWSWRHVLLVTIAGVGFGWMRHKTGSTAAAAVMHAGYNSTFFMALLVAGKDLPA
ncbi:MAG: CPBP family intramembrane metalloprotease [Bryobacterales bacterium]|nr:CPBP family intramembrane metalloprotease [Bryobacterales bacterium]